jgi:ABC-type transporter Mla subunit MlaD
MKRHVVLTTAVAALLVVTTACGSDEPSTADEVDELCDDLAAVQASLDEISGASFDPTSTTRADVEETLTSARSEVQSVLDETADVRASVTSTLTEAFDAYTAALEAIPGDGDTTLAEAAAEVSAAGAEFRATWESTLAELNCGTTATTTSD